MTTDHKPTLADELLPCPFCGGKAERIDIEEGENAGGSCISCTRCLASSNVEFEFKENFVSNWNRRAAPEAVREREDVRELIHKAAGCQKYSQRTDRLVALFNSLLRQPAAEPSGDYITHHKDWLTACEVAMEHAADQNDRDYWQHQINVLNRIERARATVAKGE